MFFFFIKCTSFDFLFSVFTSQLAIFFRFFLTFSSFYIYLINPLFFFTFLYHSLSFTVFFHSLPFIVLLFISHFVTFLSFAPLKSSPFPLLFLILSFSPLHSFYFSISKKSSFFSCTSSFPFSFLLSDVSFPFFSSSFSPAGPVSLSSFPYLNYLLFFSFHPSVHLFSSPSSNLSPSPLPIHLSFRRGLNC